MAFADCSGPQVLSAEQWQDDVAEVVTTIREVHPDPFHKVSETDFDAAAEQLLLDVPCLDDKAMVVGLAELVALLRDGHTRLAIPKQHAQLGLSIGHSVNAPPHSDALKFSQLPLQFAIFDDGVFVVAAGQARSTWIGAQVIQMGDRPLPEVLETLRRVAFAENGSADRLKIADRMSYPDILASFGLVADPAAVTLSLELPNGQRDVATLEPLPAGSGKESVALVTAFGDKTPLHRVDTENHYHTRFLREQNMVYVAINEIGNAEGGPSLAEFIKEQVALAERKKARLVIDLRNNFGGDGSYNRSIVLNLVQSESLNQYGRSFVLIGRRTLSAAQMLLNELEQYSRAIFVGEPSGSRPDHFGDSSKRQLAHSGLTLRVSSLHWSSWTANDARDATLPLIPTPWTAEAYFPGFPWAGAGR